MGAGNTERYDMKTITNGVIVKRCDDVTAAKNVKKGWKYCPKSEWKKLRKEAEKVKAL